MSDGYATFTVTSRQQWRQWLAEHGSSEPGLWVVTWKKGSGQPHVTYDDIVDEAIAAGWIDSRPRRVDEQRSSLLVTPRKPTSRWSKKNKDRVARLLADGLMQPQGLAVVAAAKASGTWTALDAVEAAREPDDLATALDAEPAARDNFDAFPRSTKRAILEWISTAKTPETRAKRIARTVTDAKQNIRANQWRQPKTARSTSRSETG